jgi:hypothetical protein
MPATQVRSSQIGDGAVCRQDLNQSEPGFAVIRKIIAGSGVTISSTGIDAGTGDVIINATGGGGSLSAVELDIDFGTTGSFSKEFSIIDVAALTSSKIFAVPSNKAPVDGYSDELEMDPITVQGRVDTNGTIILRVSSVTSGRLRNKRKINYFIV